MSAFNAANVSDALDLAGLAGQVQAVRALIPGLTCAGPAFTVRFGAVDDPAAAPAANYLEQVPEGAVVVIDNGGRTDCTVWGGLLSSFAVRRKVAGTVIWGACRDLEESRQLGHPLFAARAFMRTGKGRVRCVETGGVVRLGDVEVAPGDWIVGDDDGVVRVPAGEWPAVSAVALDVAAAEARILAAIEGGATLAEARALHRYDSFRVGGRDGR